MGAETQGAGRSRKKPLAKLINDRIAEEQRLREHNKHRERGGSRIKKGARKGMGSVQDRAHRPINRAKDRPRSGEPQILDLTIDYAQRRCGNNFAAQFCGRSEKSPSREQGIYFRDSSLSGAPLFPPSFLPAFSNLAPSASRPSRYFKIISCRARMRLVFL